VLEAKQTTDSATISAEIAKPPAEATEAEESAKPASASAEQVSAVVYLNHDIRAATREYVILTKTSSIILKLMSSCNEKFHCYRCAIIQ